MVTKHWMSERLEMGKIWKDEAYSRTVSPHLEHKCSKIMLLASVVRMWYARRVENSRSIEISSDQSGMKRETTR